MTIEEINVLIRDGFMGMLGIEFTSCTEDRVEALMPVSPKLHQPTGSVHGGALISLAESVGSAGSFLQVDPVKYQVYGSVVNAQHLHPAREGILYATASLVSRGEFKHIWDVEIRDGDNKLISISRVTNSVKPRS